MDRMSLGPQARAGIVLVLVAAVGALLGILGDRLVAQQRETPGVERETGPARTPGMMRPEMGRMRYGERLALRLDLTDAQRAQIDTILAEEQLRIRALSRQFQPQFQAVATQTRERVEAVLTADQRARLRSMRDERMRRIGDRPLLREGPRPRRDLP